MNVQAMARDLLQRDLPPTGEAQVIFRQVGKQYVTAGGVVNALVDVDLEIRRGEIFGIIGRSGAGKSSLLRTINRLEGINSGELLVDGQSVQALSESELVPFRRGIGMIFQHFNLLAAKTVFENLALPLKVAGRRPFEIHQRADYLLQLVGLKDKANSYPSRLSGGQKQRVGIARALMLEPDILLCDEATSALDPETTHSILQLLKDINRQLGITIILITHEMSVIREICDRVAVMESGRVVEQGEVWRIFGAPRHEATQALLQPLQAELPEDLQRQLRQTPLGDQDWLLLRLGFDGIDKPVPDLGQLTQLLGPQLRLLHAGIDRIQGHSQGQLLLALPGPGFSADLQQRLAQHASRVLLLGYLPQPF